MPDERDKMAEGAGSDDAGEPLAVLADFELEPRPAFLAGLRRRVTRRMAASQVARLMWELPGVVFFELVSVFWNSVKSTGQPRRRSQ